MTSKTGNKGFSLIEVMVAAALLSLGTVMIREGFLRSAELEGRLSHTMAAERWMHEKAWQARESLLYLKTAAPGSESGQFRGANKTYDWQLETQASGQEAYSLKLVVRWMEGQRPVERVRDEIFTTAKRPGTL